LITAADFHLINRYEASDEKRDNTKQACLLCVLRL